MSSPPLCEVCSLFKEPRLSTYTNRRVEIKRGFPARSLPRNCFTIKRDRSDTSSLAANERIHFGDISHLGVRIEEQRRVLRIREPVCM